MEIFLRVFPFVGRLDSAAVVENHAMDFEHCGIVLNFLGMLEERAHHPGVGEHGIEPFHRFLGRHGLASGIGLASAVCAGVVCAGGVFCSPASVSSLEYRTNAAPTPTRMMPTHRTGWTPLRPKCQGSPFWGCQIMLTRTLMTGARPKISGAMNTL